MDEKNIKENVLSKLKNKPALVHLNEKYMSDTIDDALSDVKEFINQCVGEELDGRLITPIADLCVVRLNLTGVEGILSSSKAGTSESYSDDIPKSIKSKLRKFRNLP